MFGAIVTILKKDGHYSVKTFVEQQPVFFRVYGGKTGRKAALKQAATQAQLRKCGVAPKFSLSTDEQTRLQLAGVALVNE